MEDKERRKINRSADKDTKLNVRSIEGERKKERKKKRKKERKKVEMKINDHDKNVRYGIKRPTDI